MSNTTAQGAQQAGQIGQGAQGGTTQVIQNANGTSSTTAKPNPGAPQATAKAGNASKSTYYFGPLLEYSPSEGLTKYYYAGSRLIARKDKWGKQFYHQDHLDSTRLITDESGRVVQRYDYAPFGELMSQPNPPSGKLSNDIQFGGHRQDEESGLTYMGARYYDPELGRFTSADTIVPDPTNPQALNRYSYVYNNPLSYTDPSGHNPKEKMGMDLRDNTVWWIDANGKPHLKYLDDIYVDTGDGLTNPAATEQSFLDKVFIPGQNLAGLAGEDDQENIIDKNRISTAFIPPEVTRGYVIGMILSKTFLGKKGLTGQDSLDAAMAFRGRSSQGFRVNSTVANSITSSKTPPQPSKQPAALKHGKAVDKMVRQAQRPYEGQVFSGGWELKYVERTVGGTKRVDELWVNHQRKLIQVNDTYTGPIESPAHKLKGQNYIKEPEIMALVSKGYKYDYQVNIHHPDKMH